MKSVSCVGWVTRPKETSGREQSEPIIIVLLGAPCFTQPTILHERLAGM